jgi:hypothetical protein
VATTSNCATPIKGTVYRMTKLDVCGNPVTGAGNAIVASAFVQVQNSPQYEDGTEFFERTAGGAICVNQKDDPVLKRFQVTIDFCEINVTGASYMMSARELAVTNTGYGFAVGEGLSSNRYSLEVWQNVAGAGACDPTTGVQRYIYHAWPNLGASKLGDYTIENDRSTLQIMSESRAGSTNATTGWLAKNGSSTWLPAGFSLATTDHWIWNITTTAPPVAACNPGTL